MTEEDQSGNVSNHRSKDVVAGDLQRRIELRRIERDLELRRFQRSIQDSKRKPKFDHLEHTDKSRKHIAFVFVYGYIIIVALIIAGVPLFNFFALDNKDALDLEKILAQAGALIGSPLGFVVGYYFKEDARN
jgi:hypothetical protein